MLRVVLIVINTIFTLSSTRKQWLLFQGDSLKGIESFNPLVPGVH